MTLSRNADGTFRLYLFGFPYNPCQYRLTTKDGISYRYDQFDGLLDITDRNGNSVAFGEAGVFHSSGEAIDFVRDGKGRITEFVDPSGNSLLYEYDAAGDLVSVTDREGASSNFRSADTTNSKTRRIRHYD